MPSATATAIRYLIAAHLPSHQKTYKRKLEDVQRRLETLKDRLRGGEVQSGIIRAEFKVDGTVAQQLHYMAAYVQVAFLRQTLIF